MERVTRLTVAHRRWFRAHRHEDPALVVTEAFRRVMRHAARCMKEGGYVEMEILPPRATLTPRSGEVYEMASFTLHWAGKDPQNG